LLLFEQPHRTVLNLSAFSILTALLPAFLSPMISPMPADIKMQKTHHDNSYNMN
jgi:hypothetical protein